MSPSVGEVLFQVVQILCKAQSDRALPDLVDIPDLPSPTVIHELANKALVICSPGNYTHTLLWYFYRLQRSCGKVMFLHVSVTPWQADTPAPRDGHCSGAADGTHPTGMHSRCK